jgi:hypothetical protein
MNLKAIIIQMIIGLKAGEFGGKYGLAVLLS